MTFSQPDLFGSTVTPRASTQAVELHAVVLAAQNEGGDPLYLASCPFVHDGALWYAEPTTDLAAATAARDAHNAAAHPAWGHDSEPGGSEHGSR